MTIRQAAQDMLLPQENPDLIGQSAAEETLLRAYRSGRMHHAWLLTGPKGVGKSTLAFRFARWLFAGGEDDSEPDLRLDPDDPVFRRVAAGGHADLLYIDRSVNEKTGKLRAEIGVSDTRPMRNFLHLTSAEGGWRIVIVDSAEKMTRAAANALLKPLEEPSDNCLIFIITSSLGRVLPTIRSRCRRLHLPALSEDAVARILARQCPDNPELDLAQVAHMAHGSPGRALEMIEQDGVALNRELLALMRQLPKLDSAALHGFCDKLSRPTADGAYRLVSELFGDWLARVIRAAAIENAGGAAAATQPAEEGDGVAEAAHRIAGQGAVETLYGEIAEQFRRGDQANLDRKQVLLNAFLRVSAALG